MPERVEFELVRPPIRPDLGDDELRALIRQRVEAAELELVRERAETGRSVLGMQRVLRQSWTSSCPAGPSSRSAAVGARSDRYAFAEGTSSARRVGSCTRSRSNPTRPTLASCPPWRR
jgi:hypothetical protein